MKNAGKIILTYTLIMLAALAVLYFAFQNILLQIEQVPSVSDSEMEMYKKIWEGLNASMCESRQRIFICLFVFWLFILAAGYLFILFNYLIYIKPVKDLEKYATEIAKGNLDVELKMNRNSSFGTFTESFSLMREELRASKMREVAAQKAKREMVGELSHDLKTPTATIQATCEVLQLKYHKKLDNLSDEKEKAELESELEKINIIHNKSQTIDQLVGNVFRATLDDMEEIKVEAQEKPSEMIEGFFRNLKEYGNIVFENRIPECLVLIDPLRMEQVIDNIVGNSYKYAGTDISVGFDETEDKFIRITIRDFGPGVPESDLPLLVQKFYRGRGSSGKSGYGLGLYLVKNYMERQGGGFEYYNDKGFVAELLVKKV